MIQPKTIKEKNLRNATFLSGMAAATNDDGVKEILTSCAFELERAANRMCGQGYFGCHGGDNCTSDHK